MSKQIKNVELPKCAIQDLLDKRGGGDLARKQYDLLVEKTQNPVTKSLPGKVLLNIYILRVPVRRRKSVFSILYK